VIFSWFIDQRSHHWGTPSCRLSMVIPFRGGLQLDEHHINESWDDPQRVMNVSMGISGSDWLEVPTIYKAYVREYPHISPENMALHGTNVPQYLHFRILKLPLTFWKHQAHQLFRFPQSLPTHRSHVEDSRGFPGQSFSRFASAASIANGSILWGFLKMGDPIAAIAFNTKMIWFSGTF